MVTDQTPIDIETVVELVDRFRKRRPHVHCITNVVAQNFTANVLLAAGGVPSMTVAPEEIIAFVTKSDAVLVNLGTLDHDRKNAIPLAVDAARDQAKPWLLDPVFVQASAPRLSLAKSLLKERPTLVRCNSAEAKALFDERDPQTVARETATTVVLTGKQDLMAGPNGGAKVSNGHPLMDRITAMGCALGALMVGFAAVEDDPVLASVAALVFYGVAGERAGAVSAGPGSFVPAFLDVLHTLDATALRMEARLQ